MAEPTGAESPAGRAPELTQVPVRALAMAVFAVLVVLAASAPVDWTVTTRFNPLDPAGLDAPTLRPVAPPSDLGSPEATTIPWAAPVLWSVLVVVGVVLAVLLARRLWRARPRRRVQVMTDASATPTGIVLVEDQAAALRRGAMTALDLLDGVPDPQDAVVRSWLALEQAATGSGAPRRPADSPTEFARSLLAVTGADSVAVTELLRLYHRARFSSHPVGIDEVRRARACVIALSRSLAGYENALRNSVTRDPARRSSVPGQKANPDRAPS